MPSNTPVLCSTADLVLTPEQAADSRGRPTVAVLARCQGFEARGDCPAGASKGADEAQTVAVPQAMANVTEVLLPHLRAAAVDVRCPRSLLRLDVELATLAGDNFCVLGANATLPVSRALWRLGARARGEPLWALLRRAAQLEGPAPEHQVGFFMNIYNGGLHALRPESGEQLGRERIDIQEIMVVPVRASSYGQAMAQGEAIDAALKALLLDQYGAQALTRADEAGFSVRGLGDNDVAIGHVFTAIQRAGLEPGRDVKLALDVAASSFYDAASGRYRFGGASRDTQQMLAWLGHFAERYEGQVLSIEDGLDENDWAGWSQLCAQMNARGIATIGDDLFVTQLPRLERGIAQRSASAILIKVNQNGTVGGTLAVMQRARAAGLRCVVSHRSGETLDDSIADLAVATQAWGLKAGDPQPPGDFPDRQSWVRRAKYLRMVATEAEQAAIHAR